MSTDSKEPEVVMAGCRCLAWSEGECLCGRYGVAVPIPDDLCGVEGCCFTPHDGGHTWEEPE